MSNIKSSPFIALIKGIIISYIITVAIFFMLALLITYTNFEPKYTATITKVVTVTVCIICGIITSAGAQSRGLIWGIVSGILYTAIMVGIGFIIMPNYAVSLKTAICLGLSLCGGGLGGVIGINIKSA